MNLQDLAQLTGKSMQEVREMLDKQGIIELDLSERENGI